MAPSSRAPRIHAPDPVSEALQNAPLDDEPVTDEDRAALAEGRDAVRRGDVMTTAELRRALEL